MSIPGKDNKTGGILVIAEVHSGSFHPATFELLTAARKWAHDKSGPVVCAAACAPDVLSEDILFEYGADIVIFLEAPGLTYFMEEHAAEAYYTCIQNYAPELVIGAATSYGLAVISRTGQKCRQSAVADVVDMPPLDGNPYIRFLKPVMGGNKIADILYQGTPAIAALRPKTVKAEKLSQPKTGEVVRIPVTEGSSVINKEILSFEKNKEGRIQLADADYIVAGGRGMKGAEGFDLLKELADLLGGALAASRAAVDAGWVPYGTQVGQTGQTVNSRVYLACGISGQIQHLVGMRSCEYIIAINTDPDAPIMENADLAIEGDLFEIIPALIQKLKGNST